MKCCFNDNATTGSFKDPAYHNGVEQQRASIIRRWSSYTLNKLKFTAEMADTILSGAKKRFWKLPPMEEEKR